MNLIITGALGHIGSYVLRNFSTQTSVDTVYLLDNLSSNRYCSLFDLPSHNKYKFIECDVRSYNLSNIITPDDVVIHLAAITDAAGSFDRAKEVEDNNYNSTQNVAEACALQGSRLIHISSTSVYGSQQLVVDESCGIADLQPQSPYAHTKLKEEALIKSLSVEKELRAITCRFGTIYGTSPGMRFHTAVNKFIFQAITDQPLTVWSTAYNQKRPYLSLYDANMALSHIINKDIFNGEVYNVLTENLTVKEVVDCIKLHKPNLNIEFVENRIMNQLSYEVDCSKFMKTGFVFRGGIKVGVRDTFDLLSNINI